MQGLEVGGQLLYSNKRTGEVVVERKRWCGSNGAVFREEQRRKRDVEDGTRGSSGNVEIGAI